MNAEAMHNPCAIRSNINTVKFGAIARKRSWNRKCDEADQYASSTIDMPAEQGHDQSRECHAHCASIDGKGHCRRRHAISPGERRQNSLGRKKIDNGKKCGQADDNRA